MNIQEIYLEDSFADDIVRSSIEDIFIAFSQKLDQIEAAKLEIPNAIELAMNKLHTIVNLATLEYDGTIIPDEAFERLEPDMEPLPNTIDSWARGTVSTRKVVTDENSFRRVVPARSTTPSVSSYRSSATGKSKATSKSYKSNTSKQSNQDKSGQIIELEEYDQFNNLNATGFMFDMLQKTKKKAQGGNFYQESEGAKGEFELLEEQLAKASKEMRGKKFVLDRYGQPVEIGRVDPAKLPAFAVNLNSSVKPDEERKTSKDHHNLDNEKSKQKRFIRVAGSRTVEENSFQPNRSLATTLSAVETIPKINPGVVVKNKATSKGGDEFPEDPKHMSKKTYLEKTMNSSSSQSLDGSSFSSGARRRNPLGLKSNQSVGNDSNYNESVLQSLDSLADINPLEGSRKIVNDEQSYDLSDDDLGLGPINTTGDVSRAKLPKKPSQKQRENIDMLTGSPNNGKPRDRDLPKNVRAVADRKHLPAPPLGQTTGHGLINLEKYHELSAMTNSYDSSASEWHQQWRN